MSRHDKRFDFEHLSPELQKISKPFAALVEYMEHEFYINSAMLPDYQFLMQNLLQAKDCAVRLGVINTSWKTQKND
jgi:hypothetical protein